MTTASNPFEGVQVVKAEQKAETKPAQPLATEKQVRFLASLCAEIARLKGEADETDVNGLRELPRRLASSQIDAAIQMRDALRAEARQSGRKPAGDVPEAIHEVGGEVFKVQRAVHGSGKLYAKQLNTATGEFEYKGRAPLSRLSEDTVMSLDRAKELGHVYGMCMRCGATLTDEGSIEAGIGPVCATKF